jgi:hypothetical protein
MIRVCGVSKSKTVPVPVIPILETPQVFSYLWKSLLTSCTELTVANSEPDFKAQFKIVFLDNLCT